MEEDKSVIAPLESKRAREEEGYIASEEPSKLLAVEARDETVVRPSLPPREYVGELTEQGRQLLQVLDAPIKGWIV